MVKYLFKLKQAHVPDLTRVTDKDILYSGVRLTYIVKIVHFFRVFNLDVVYSARKLGEETFLNPFKKYWIKSDYRVPPAYWGKINHPLTRLWVTINPEINPLGSLKIVPKETLLHRKVKILKRPFLSKQVAAHLFKRSSKFYINTLLNQSNHE